MKKLFLILALGCFLVTEVYAQQKPNRDELTIDSLNIHLPKTRNLGLNSPNSSRKSDYDTTAIIRYGEGEKIIIDFSGLKEIGRQFWESPELNQFLDRQKDGIREFKNYFETMGSGSLSGVSVSPLQQDSHIVNISFKTQSKEPVYISVIDTEGNPVVKQTLFQVKENHVTQIVIPEESKGIHFFILSQNGNGTTVKVNIQ